MPMFCPGDFPDPVVSRSICGACGEYMKNHDFYEGDVDGEDWG